MRVVVTRDKSGDIEIWGTDNPNDLVLVGRYYLSKEKCTDGINYAEKLETFSAAKFKTLFGFTPRKGSKKAYVLTLKELEK